MGRRDLGAAGGLNLLKLCVGAATPTELLAWQRYRGAQLQTEIGDPRPRHTTRMQPKRAEELLDGGSLYWVFKGVVLARQRLEAIEPVTGSDGVRRYDLVLDPTLIPTRPQPRRPFQGWRYLTLADAPPDARGAGREAPEAPLPPTLERALAEIGVV